MMKKNTASGHIAETASNAFADRVVKESQLSAWSPLQRYLEALSELVNLDFLVVDAERVCLCGTRSMRQCRGFRALPTTTLVTALTLPEPLLVVRGEGEKCRNCTALDNCQVQASLTAAVSLHSGVLVVVQIVACTRPVRKVLLRSGERLLEGIRHVVRMSKVPPAASHAPAVEKAYDHAGSLRYLIGDSPAVQKLKESICKAAKSDATVLIQGESGTGKELAANAVHEESSRRGKPFIAVNCGAISDTLFESELFGYEKGAFSGAAPTGKKGFLEAAHTGTLFLDEISEMPYALQVKLLRFLQERTFYRVGGNKLTKVDVRVIAASNTCLSSLVAQGKFRDDLYFRLNVIPLKIPPLRERKEDIILLVGHFLDELSDHDTEISVTSELMHAFESYRWPGNIRELKNFVEYGVHFCENCVLTLDIMQSRFEQGQRAVQTAESAQHSGELQELQRLLSHYGHSVSGKRKAAKQMGISLATLYRRLAEKHTR